jgi:hypothetical protein
MKKNKGLSVVALIVIPCSALAWEMGPAASYSNVGESLNINGRSVQLKTGGFGLRASESFFGQHIVVDASALYGYTGSASATFSGADVSGPANLTTYKTNVTLYWSPQSRATPFLRLGHVRQRGDSDFNGSRNGSPVQGRANLSFDRDETAIGLRVLVSDNLTVFGETGRHSWRLVSDAVGSVGPLRARTQIQANHTDPLFRIGATYWHAHWRASAAVGQYRMTADNQTTTRSVGATIAYAF